MSNIGERVRLLREKQGINQDQLGKAIGVRQTTISEIENGRNKPSWKTLESLSDYFSVQMSYFLQTAESETNSEKVA